MKTRGALHQAPAGPLVTPQIDSPAESDSVIAELNLAAARVAAVARDTAAESERNRRVSPEVLDHLRIDGLGGAAVPAAVGGREIDPSDLLGLIETVARGDGSAGWVTMIYATSSVAGHYLHPDGLDEVFAEGPASLTSGVLAPRGTAKRVDGGYMVKGTWPFASGSIDASWIALGAMADDASRLSFFLPRNEVEILDTWDVMGLRATASHDVAVDNRFVPDSRVFDLSGPSRTQEPIARFPVFGLLAAGIGAAVSGSPGLRSTKRPTWPESRFPLDRSGA